MDKLILHLDVTQPTLKESAQCLYKNFKKGEVFYLIGSIGSGKTTFVRHFLRMSASHLIVPSPSFTIANYYKEVEALHLDLYNIRDEVEIHNLGIEEWLGTTLLIEWSDKWTDLLPRPDWIIRFDNLSVVKIEKRFARLERLISRRRLD